MVNVINYRAALVLVFAFTSTGSAASTTFSGVATPYQIESPDTGSCRLKGIDKTSDNFKYFASVSSAVSTMNEGCGRCVKVTKEGAPSLIAFVLDVCTGCKNQDVKLSTETLAKLSIDPNSHTTSVNYKFVSCPRQYVSGNVKACLMEGGSDTYIPLQFYNTQKVLKDVQISGEVGTQQKDSFFYSVNPKTSAGKEWYKTIDVSLTSTDGETQTGSFAFEGTSGCATSSFQFSAASTADGKGEDVEGAGTGGGGVNLKLILPLVLGCVGAIIVLIGSVLLVRRHRRSGDKEDDDKYDVENQFMSPVATKPLHESTDYSPRNDHPGPDEEGTFSNSPGYDFDESVTPPASASHVPVPAPQPQYQQALPAYVYDARAPPLSTESQKPKYSYTAPSYAFSKPESPDRQADRSSFDIDDLRQTEEFKSQSQRAMFSPDVVTSPQSYVRATALRRKGSQESVIRFSAPMDRDNSMDSRPSDILGYPHGRSQRSNITEAQF